MRGRKRHIVVDTTGYPIVVVVHAANIYDGHAAKEVLSLLFSIVNTVRKIWADGGYKGEAFIDWCKEKFNCEPFAKLFFYILKMRFLPGFMIKKTHLNQVF